MFGWQQFTETLCVWVCASPSSLSSTFIDSFENKWVLIDIVRQIHNFICFFDCEHILTWPVLRARNAHSQAHLRRFINFICIEKGQRQINNSGFDCVCCARAHRHTAYRTIFDRFDDIKAIELHSKYKTTDEFTVRMFGFGVYICLNFVEITVRDMLFNPFRSDS